MEGGLTDLGKAWEALVAYCHKHAGTIYVRTKQGERMVNARLADLPTSTQEALIEDWFMRGQVPVRVDIEADQAEMAALRALLTGGPDV